MDGRSGQVPALAGGAGPFLRSTRCRALVLSGFGEEQARGGKCRTGVPGGLQPGDGRGRCSMRTGTPTTSKLMLTTSRDAELS